MRPSRRGPTGFTSGSSSIATPLSEPFPDGVEVAHLEEEANSVGGRLGRGARDLEEAAAEKEDHAAGFWYACAFGQALADRHPGHMIGANPVVCSVSANLHAGA